jgi:hypothetical protein
MRPRDPNAIRNFSRISQEYKGIQRSKRHSRIISSACLHCEIPNLCESSDCWHLWGRWDIGESIGQSWAHQIYQPVWYFCEGHPYHLPITTHTSAEQISSSRYWCFIVSFSLLALCVLSCFLLVFFIYSSYMFYYSYLFLLIFFVVLLSLGSRPNCQGWSRLGPRLRPMQRPSLAAPCSPWPSPGTTTVVTCSDCRHL